MSVRQRAVDLLYAMCDTNNAEEIVAEMLTYLETADYAIKEEMVGAKNDEFIVFFLSVLLQLLIQLLLHVDLYKLFKTDNCV